MLYLDLRLPSAAERPCVKPQRFQNKFIYLPSYIEIFLKIEGAEGALG